MPTLPLGITIITPAFPWTLKHRAEEELGPGTIYPINYGIDAAGQIYWATKQIRITGTIAASQGPGLSTTLQINALGPERATAPIHLLTPTSILCNTTTPPGDFVADFIFQLEPEAAAPVNDYAQQRFFMRLAGGVTGPIDFNPMSFVSDEFFAAGGPRVGTLRLEERELALYTDPNTEGFLSVQLAVERIPF